MGIIVGAKIAALRATFVRGQNKTLLLRAAQKYFCKTPKKAPLNVNKNLLLQLMTLQNVGNNKIRFARIVVEK